MALEEPQLYSEQSYVELTCGTENLSPYSSGSSYSDQSTYYQTDYDWHHHHTQQQQQQQHYHQQQDAQQQQLPAHAVQSIQQITDLHASRQYYTPTSYHQDTQELTPVTTYPSGLSQHSLPQSDFYSPVLWPNTQSEYIPATSLTSQTRLFSGIDVSQHVVPTPLQNNTQTQPTQNTKPKRKRVQSCTQRKAANVRERRRMFHLNEAFDVLRKRLPAFNYEKRLSRIETLRLAMTYISFMKDVSVGEDPKGIKLKPHGLDLGRTGSLPGMDPQDGGGSLNSSSNSENCDLNAFANEYSDSSSNDGSGMGCQGGLQ